MYIFMYTNVLFNLIILVASIGLLLFLLFYLSLFLYFHFGDKKENLQDAKRFFEEGFDYYKKQDFTQAKRCFREYLFFLTSEPSLLRDPFIKESNTLLFEAFPELVSEFSDFKK
ncbi:MAG: hypothetical protein AABZ60_15320 [Planctomycetota bacterium]